VFCGEAFHHPLAAGTAALPGWKPSGGCSFIVCKRHNPGENPFAAKRVLKSPKSFLVQVVHPKLLIIQTGLRAI
jgi:hypothetical protein